MLRVKQSTAHLLRLHSAVPCDTFGHCNHNTWQRQPKGKGFIWVCALSLPWQGGGQAVQLVLGSKDMTETAYIMADQEAENKMG